MVYRVALHALAIRAPLTYSLIWSLLINPRQPNFKGKKYFHKMLKRALMTKMMMKIWQSTPLPNEMRARTLCVCHAGVANENPCLLYWFRFLVQEQFFVGSWGRQIHNSISSDYMQRRLMEVLPEASSKERWAKADYALMIGDTDEAIRLFCIL